MIGSCNSAISVIVNCSQDESNPLGLTHNEGNAQEMTIQCCQEQILITTNVERVLEIEALSEQERWEVFQFPVFKNSHHQGDLLLHRNEMEDISRAIFRTIAAKSYLIEGVAHILAKFNNPFYWQLKSTLFSSPQQFNSSTGRISETLLEPAKLWLERWNDVIEDAETTIAECNDDDQGSTCCMPRRNNMRRIKQAMKNIKEMHNETPTFIMTFFLHILTQSQSQIGFQDARNGAPQFITQMAVTHPMPNVLKRLQDTASTVTISTEFNGQLLCGEIDTHSPDFALTMGSCNPPISVIVNCSEDEGNPLALTNNVGNAQEMTIKCCEQQILITTNVDRVLEIEALSEQERWEVFQFHVFKNSHHQGDLLLHRNDMEDISRAIFRPIAAKSYLIEGVAHILAKFINPFYCAGFESQRYVSMAFPIWVSARHGRLRFSRAKNIRNSERP
ncbi:uncharacterized protein LOC131054721 [Cryptomeria japonica]|uniref:uncharacterized protein LOC131054721 n=1 Tax=Cryptomeria japonica TaxID=3369 RepID=UPI0027D9FE09|nr:uncharacterized protein LOC131054721 [Cryptomeria japonica]XP_057845283.2 uncharacterized protein LOC131054721 [Cryptomeria japonica]XP_057845285.2 uncharacterized protein LOC131054721 [Cryptomeria japonica]XP_059077243.1 uncharacterized protein LOC131054721 [Cryptomeria japonica]XP_059077244.1 uncharacterized protein LOC131054721 [Cryptomeria japonica]